MIISIVNMSGTIPDAEVQRVIRAVNRQIREDFEPYWSLGAMLRLEGKSQKSPNKLSLPDLRGDAILYLYNKVDVSNALGYHQANARGIPYGFVFTELSAKMGEEWSVTLSHEALELIADPLVNLLVAGPHPSEDRTVFHWYEMSDAVQGESYEIDAVKVSNFVLPLYFTPTAERGSRNDFLGHVHEGETLPSFGINPGGYVGFFDPKKNEHVTFAVEGDATARKRLAAKKALASSAGVSGRRAYRVSGWPRDKAPQTESRSLTRGAVAPPAAAQQPEARATGIQAVEMQAMAQAVSRRCERKFAAVDTE